MKCRFWFISISAFLMTSAPMILNQFADADQTKALTVNPRRLAQRIEELAEYGKTPEGGVNRVAFSEEDIRSRSYILSLLNEAGLKTRIDEAGNIIGERREF